MELDTEEQLGLLVPSPVPRAVQAVIHRLAIQFEQLELIAGRAEPLPREMMLPGAGTLLSVRDDRAGSSPGAEFVFLALDVTCGRMNKLLQKFVSPIPT